MSARRAPAANARKATAIRPVAAEGRGRRTTPASEARDVRKEER